MDVVNVETILHPNALALRNTLTPLVVATPEPEFNDTAPISSFF